MDAERVTSIPSTRDAEWLAHHARLDSLLNAEIRTAVVDERFDDKVWTLIRAAEAEALATQKKLRTRLGAPWWLDALNVIAVVVAVVTVAAALGAAATRLLAATSVFVGRPSDAIRVGAVIASVAIAWFGVRLGANRRLH